jgi:hypothetical protein
VRYTVIPQSSGTTLYGELDFAHVISDSRILGQPIGLRSLYFENAESDFEILLVCVVSIYSSPRTARAFRKYHPSSRNIL